MFSRGHRQFSVFLSLFVVPLSFSTARADDVSRICGRVSNHAIVNRSGLLIRVPERWYSGDSSGRFHLTRDQLDAAREGNGDWEKEFCEVCNKMLPFEDCVARIDGDVQLRVYLADDRSADVHTAMTTRGIAEVKRLGEGEELSRFNLNYGVVTSATVGEWKEIRIRYPRWYWDYGGMAHIDCFVRGFEAKTVVLVFMHRDVDAEKVQSTVQSIVSSVHWLDKFKANALFFGRSKTPPGEPISMPR